MKNVTTYVGMDAHKKDLFVAMLIGNEKTPVTWQLANEPTAVRRLVRKLEREAPGPVHVFYEAGPCGYALQRQLTTPRVQCDVIAPALIPRKPGERVKTNRRDAQKLVELGRAGLLTAVQPPTPADEAVRDLARARDDAREDLQRCRHRLTVVAARAALRGEEEELDADPPPVDRHARLGARGGARRRRGLPPGDRSTRGAAHRTRRAAH
jgi:transposase